MPSPSRRPKTVLLDNDNPWGLVQPTSPPRRPRAAAKGTPAAAASASAVPAVPPLPFPADASRPPRPGAAAQAERPVETPAAARHASHHALLIAGTLVVCGACAWGGWVAAVAAISAQASAVAAPSTGRLIVSSHPAGAEVSIGGRAYGQTPLAIDLAPGRFSVVLVSPDGGETQTFVTNVRAGESQPHHVAWPAPARAGR